MHMYVLVSRKRKQPKTGRYYPQVKEENITVADLQGKDKPTLLQSSRKSFMNSETELDTFDPAKCPAPAADGQSE